jgi:hypothetical protein
MIDRKVLELLEALIIKVALADNELGSAVPKG